MIEHLLENNKNWAKEVAEENPTFFPELSKQQKPQYLWIGCADSRVPANQVIGLPPGEVFVHRNVANLVVHSDLNCLSVIQYAVFNLGVKDIIVCGHYGCGGVHAALGSESHGLIDNWLMHIKDIIRNRKAQLDKMDDSERGDRMCEINVMEQVANVGHTTILQGAWKAGKEVAVHGLIYGLKDGKIKDLSVSISSLDDLANLDKKLNYI
jgi:carbonic anhydrase